LGATLRTIYHGRFDTIDRGEERKAAEVVAAPPDRNLTHHPAAGVGRWRRRFMLSGERGGRTRDPKETEEMTSLDRPPHRRARRRREEAS
jgi:hypothetical protein